MYSEYSERRAKMSDQEIAEKMVEIVDEFQRQTGMPDEVADNVVRHCFRKMELIDAPAEYILLLLPDELKNACFRRWRNKRTMEHVPLMRCKECGEGIYEGDEYYDTGNGGICKECIEDMTANELFDLFGESYSVAAS